MASSSPHAHMTSQPPSPNGISAAAILATLSDSRPSSSHVGHIHAFSDDDEPGGISLTNYIDSFSAPEVPFASHHAPEDPGDAAQVSMDQTPYTALDQHAAALEALTMEQLPTPSLPIPTPDNLDAIMSITFSGHQDFVPSTYEEHLSIHDTTAFFDITSFFQYYARLPKALCPSLEIVQPPETVTREDLNGDKCDFQGIDWTERAPRSDIRAQRDSFEKAKIRHRVFEGHGITHSHRLRNTEDYFAFQRMNTRHRVIYPHFQLRNLMTALSRNDIIYATKKAILRTDALGSPAVPIIDLQKRLLNGSPCQVTTLAAQDNVLIAGGFEGDYAIADLSSTSEESVHYGMIKDYSAESKSYISNHVHMFNSRTSYTPQAVLCSNDYRLRVLDCTTDTFIHSFMYPTAVNCSATSPDGRMRVIVGDFHETLIANAETGQPFETLNAHSDHAFACAWADDGIHVASAAQDSTIAVWDARFWQRPLVVMPSELSIPRVLRFSPIGSGPRVLISAEADDYISIINAQTWDSKQVFDFFGPVAGISMTPDGQSLFVANSDRRFGGIIELERTGRAGHDAASRARSRWTGDDTYAGDDISDDFEHADWGGDSDMEVDPRVMNNASARERRGVDLGDFVI
ncbi:WD40 repeat-like protein [Periconia macrospinosa]|uniref:WD40 repeat-like protein n=1 Tax=Periconia macrospinosa TaxID=97972 RepID=A0A2V1ECL3_9PLEO|nr:WD40 repeat-like protein [Periconia macrospinosa]